MIMPVLQERFALLTFRTSNKEEATLVAAEDIGLCKAGLTLLLCVGSLGSTAFLARSLRAAAKVDLLCEGEMWGDAGGISAGGLFGEGEDGIDCGLTAADRSESNKSHASVSLFEI